MADLQAGLELEGEGVVRGGARGERLRASRDVAQQPARRQQLLDRRRGQVLRRGAALTRRVAGGAWPRVRLVSVRRATARAAPPGVCSHER